VLKIKFMAGPAATTLLAGSALAQTTAPTQPAGPGQVMTQMPPDLMRGSQLMGIDVYGADNQKIGDIAIVRPDAVHQIGLVVPQRDPMTPITTALVNEAKHLAAKLGMSR
jgi:hypothetical protein